jgi:hypothetical protein
LSLLPSREPKSPNSSAKTGRPTRMPSPTDPPNVGTKRPNSDPKPASEPSNSPLEGSGAPSQSSAPTVFSSLTNEPSAADTTLPTPCTGRDCDRPVRPVRR